MNRFEQLASIYSSGHLSAAESAELARILEEDADAKRLFLGWWEQEQLLRAEFGNSSAMRRDIMDAVRQEHASVKTVVLAEIHKLPPSRPMNWLSIRGMAQPLAWAASLVFALFLAFGVLKKPSNSDRSPVELVSISSDVVVERNQRDLSVGHQFQLKVGDIIRVPHGKKAMLRYFGSGDSLQLGGESQIEIAEVGFPKRIHLNYGQVVVESTQSETSSLVITTPNGTARADSSHISLTVNTRETRLVVHQGVAHFTHWDGRADCDVSAGHLAVANRERLLPPQPLPLIAVDFGEPTPEIPQDALLDKGEKFDPRRGYGWIQIPARTASDKLTTDTSRVAWRMRLANGKYLVTVGLEDSVDQEEVDLIRLQGKPIAIADLPDEPVEATNIPVTVSQGELVVEIPEPLDESPTVTHSAATLLSYLIIRPTADSGNEQHFIQ